MPDPDYNGHLQAIYPSTQWEISRFSHGSINATHRAVKTAGEAGPSSLVLKHASPFFVDEDTDTTQPFSIKRQEIEATIMTSYANLVQPANGCDTWRIPRFLHRSQGKESELLRTEKDGHVSITLIEDLGYVRNLRDTILAFAEAGPSTQIDELVSNIGRTLGCCLAKMHSAETTRVIEASNVQDILSQKLTEDVVWFLAMELLPEYLASAPRAKEYFQWLVDDMQKPQHTYPPCLMHGDFNYGNILMPADALETNNSQPLVVDWEFATSHGRGVNGDLSEFLAPILCRIIGGRATKSVSARLFQNLCVSFCAAYRETANLVCKMHADDLNTQLYRSALLLTGRDVLVFAHDACADYPAFDELVKLGLWYFERAGANMEEFVSEANQVQLEKEDEGLIRSLFVFE